MQAGPISLATTLGISVDFFSSGYLDVSVRRVRHHRPMYSVNDSVSKHTGFPHSEIAGYNGSYHLTDAFRRLARPSSPVIAKASTMCTYSLDPITLNSIHITGQAKALVLLSPPVQRRDSRRLQSTTQSSFKLRTMTKSLLLPNF